MKYAWAHALHEDEGWFGHFSREEAVTEGLENAIDYEFDEFYIAPTVPIVLDDIVEIDAETVIDSFLDQQGELMPEDCDWLQKVEPEKMRELDSLLKATVIEWIERHGLHPEWFDIDVSRTERILVSDCSPKGAS